MTENEGTYLLFGRCDQCWEVVVDAPEHEVMTAVLVHRKCVDEYLLAHQKRQDKE